MKGRCASLQFSNERRQSLKNMLAFGRHADAAPVTVPGLSGEPDPLTNFSPYKRRSAEAPGFDQALPLRQHFIFCAPLDSFIALTTACSLVFQPHSHLIPSIQFLRRKSVLDPPRTPTLAPR